MIKVDLTEFKKYGVYSVETNPIYNPKAETFLTVK